MIVIRAALDPQQTADHEMIHALKNLGLFTPAEWAVLEARARNLWTKKHALFLAAYDDVSPVLILDQAIAQEFAMSRKEGRVPKRLVSTGFQTIAHVLWARRLWITRDARLMAADVFEAGRGSSGPPAPVPSRTAGSRGRCMHLTVSYGW